jgi:hypothetical protein
VTTKREGKAGEVVVRLTLAEAQELLCVAGNGYGDGDFYQMNAEGVPERGLGHGYRAYCRAHDKMRAAIQKASARRALGRE